MRRYRLQQDVPVVWVTDLRKFRRPPPFPFESSKLLDSVRSAWKTLKAGTFLDAPPLVVGSALTEDLGFAKVCVDGRHGLVELDSLQGALPDWETHAVPAVAT